jgi:hypothetical protein
LWPSFNVIELTSERVRADVVSFGYRQDTLGETRISPLVDALREGPHWRPQPVAQQPEAAPERQLAHNSMICALQPSRSPDRWDVHYVRRYEGEPGQAPRSFEDTVDALEDSELVPLNAIADRGANVRTPPCQMRLYRGQEALYRVEGALCRHVREAHRLFGKRWAPYSWLGVMNRYFARRLYLEVRVEHPFDCLQQAFASETDLGTGASAPLPLVEAHADRVVVVYENCAARTLVRIHWPMETA